MEQMEREPEEPTGVERSKVGEIKDRLAEVVEAAVPHVPVYVYGRDDGDGWPCDYCIAKGREWTPECEANK